MCLHVLFIIMHYYQDNFYPFQEWNLETSVPMDMQKLLFPVCSRITAGIAKYLDTVSSA